MHDLLAGGPRSKAAGQAVGWSRIASTPKIQLMQAGSVDASGARYSQDDCRLGCCSPAEALRMQQTMTCMRPLRIMQHGALYVLKYLIYSSLNCAIPRGWLLLVGGGRSRSVLFGHRGMFEFQRLVTPRMGTYKAG